MAEVSEEARVRAEAKFAKAQKAAREAEKAWVDHNAQAQAVRAKTDRLRALRVAKEAADKDVKATAKKATAKKKPTTRRKKASP